MERKSQPKTLDDFKPYLYRGFFHCGECGCFITTETQKGHNYLRCTKRVKKDCSQRYVREESVAEQITEVLASAAIPDDWADWITNELESDKKNDTEAAAVQAIDAKLDRLMVGYLDQLYGPEEYKEKKNQLLAEKQTVLEKVAALGRNRSSRFEPAIRFISELKQAKIVASQGNAEEQREFFKKVGSNPELVNRTLRFVPRNAWQLVVDSGRFAQHTTAAPHGAAVLVGKTDHNLNEAEEARFELAVSTRPTPAFKTGPFSRSGTPPKPVTCPWPWVLCRALWDSNQLTLRHVS